MRRWPSRRKDDDFHAEIEAHLAIESDQLAAAGMNHGDAAAAARRAFGNVVRSRERFYRANRWMWLDHLRRDLRQALRQLRQAPATAAIIIASLALGIGFNTAIYSLADQALKRPLPVARPGDLVLLDWHGAFIGGGVGTENLFSLPFYRDLAAETAVFAGLFARCPIEVHVAWGGAGSEAAAAEMVTGSYFPTLGVRPAAGRLLDEGDDRQPGGHPVAVLSHDYWRRRLGGDPHVVGRRILVNNQPFTVVGVAAPTFRGVDWGAVPALWLPVMMKRQATPTWDAFDDRRTRWLHVFGRLRQGSSAAAAKVRLEPWFKAYLAADTRREGWPPVTAGQMREYLASSLDVLPAAHGRSDLGHVLGRPILILLGATGLILLLACLNVANLSLARALARHRSAALRAALGASRRRLLAERLIESGVLAAAGAALGLVAAPMVMRAVLTFLPSASAAVGLQPALDLRVLVFAAAVTVLIALLSGAAPALFAARVPPAAALKEEPASMAGGQGVRRALVVGQFALALVLLVAAGLFARTLGALRAQGPGFATGHLLMFRLEPLNNGYDAARARALSHTALDAMRQLPDVAEAAVSRFETLGGGGWNNPITLRGRRQVVTDTLAMNAVSPGYFDTLGVPVLRGRDFDERDDPHVPAAAQAAGNRMGLDAAIVNQAFVDRYLAGEDPLGVSLGIGGGPDAVVHTKIIGVVRNFHDFALRRDEPEVFFDYWQTGAKEIAFYARSRRPAAAVLPAMRQQLHRLDPALTVLSLRTFDDQLDRMLAAERLLAVLAAAFAAAATVLATIGLYGVLAFSATRRQREIGIRLALGASRRAAGGLILREAAQLAAAGMAIALPASWAVGQLVASQLFGVRPMDGISLLLAAGVLAAVCLLAAAAPAHQAQAVDPLAAIRSGD